MLEVRTPTSCFEMMRSHIRMIWIMAVCMQSTTQHQNTISHLRVIRVGAGATLLTLSKWKCITGTSGMQQWWISRWQESADYSQQSAALSKEWTGRLWRDPSLIIWSQKRSGLVSYHTKTSFIVIWYSLLCPINRWAAHVSADHLQKGQAVKRGTFNANCVKADLGCSWTETAVKRFIW